MNDSYLMEQMLSYLIAAHLFGDFPLQNHWMQRKAQSSFVCTVHVLCYSLPFWGLVALGIVPGWLVVVLLVEHWFQDRFGLHIKWMKFYRQTTPDKWPVGPLCMDQAWHVSFIMGCVLLHNFIT